MNINKKIIYLSLFIVTIIITVTGTTTALMNYREDIIIDNNSYTTSYLQINNNISNNNNVSFNPIPLEDSEGISTVEPQIFTITNTGNLPYIFEIQFLPTTEGGIKSQYIKMQIDDYMPFKLSTLNTAINDNDKETYIRKSLQNYYLLPGESIELSVKVWLDIDTPNSELNKNISLNLVVTGYADKITKDTTPSNLEGDGSQENPYLIASIEDLIKFKDSVNNGNTYEGKYIKLAGTLDFNSPISYANENCQQNNEYNFNKDCEQITSFTPIGTISTPFKGTFDGDNNFIKNIPYQTESELGLFGYTDKATISNLNIVGNYNINDNENISQLIVGSIATKTNLGTILNCYSKVNYQINDLSNKNLIIGGIVGESNGTTITDNYNLGTIKIINSMNSYVGGIVGIENTSTDNFNNYNYGYIATTSSNNSYIGGIVGSGYANGETYNFGVVNNNSLTKNSNSYIGGILGYSKGTINNHNNYGLIINSSSSNYSYTGGIVGYSSSNINNSKNYANIKTSNSNTTSINYIGGITGYSSGTIDKSSNTGQIISTNTTSINYIGGITGFLSNNQKISNTSNSGTITCNIGYVGGIIGKTDNNIILSNSYNLGNINISNKGQTSYIGGIIGYANQLNLINTAYNTGNITVEELEEINLGGIIGKVLDNSSINYTYNKGDLKIQNIDNGTIGGIVGYATNTSIVYNYSVGRITNNSSSILEGGAIGRLENTNSYPNKVYAISSSTSSIESSESIDKNTSFMVTKSYMMSKDFLELLNKEENQWEQQDQINDGLPYLKNLKPNS